MCVNIVPFRLYTPPRLILTYKTLKTTHIKDGLNHGYVLRGDITDLIYIYADVTPFGKKRTETFTDTYLENFISLYEFYAICLFK